MIVAAGLSPAWQQILIFDAFAEGEVNRAREVHWCGSGKVLNVGISLAHLGDPCATLAPLGGQAREAIEREFAALQAPLRVVLCEQPTRVCTTILDRTSGRTTELVQEAGTIAPGEAEAFADEFARLASSAKVVILSGSLPAGVPQTYYRELLARTDGVAVLDARGPELLAALEGKPLVVKPNREELAKTVGRDLSRDDALLSAMRELDERGATWVVITDGKEAVWVTSNTATFRLDPPRVERIVNPIGCGDALAAGLAVGIARETPIIDAVRLGMAAAADRLAQLLPGRLDITRVEALAARITAQSV